MYHSINLYHCLFALILSGFMLPAGALETVIVSGTRYEADSRDIPSHVSVITADDIALSGADHLIEILRKDAGLQVSDLFGDGTDANVGLRGFSSTSAQNTLIMIDGRRLNNVDNSLPDLNAVSLGNIEQVEIVKGSMGSLYGDKAVGGVINIITRKPDSLRLQVETGYGSFDNRTLFAGLENRHENGIHYRISAHRLLSDNYRENNHKRLTDITSRAGYDYDGGELFVEYQGLSEMIGLPGALFSDLLQEDRRQALNPADAIRTRTDVGRIGFRHGLFDHLDFLAEYTNRFNDIQGVLSSAGTPQGFTSKRHHIEYTPRLIASFPMVSGVGHVTLGLDWFRTDYLIVSDFGITDDTQTQSGLYARVSAPVTDSLTVTAGGRLGKVRNDILVDTLNFGRSLPEGSEIDDKANAWELGVSYRIHPDWRIFGKLDRNYRFVTADEYSAIADNNFFADLFSFGELVPFPVTQTGLSMELGAEWRHDDDYFSMQVYRLNIDDEIVFDPVLFLNTNLGNTRRDGLILEGRYNPTDKLSLTAGYSYLDAEYTSGRFEGNDLTFLSRHTGSISAGYRFTPRLQTYIEWLGVSDKPFDGDFAGNYENLAGHATVNLDFSYQIERFRVSARVNNLLDAHYSEAGVIAFDFRQAFPSPQVETWYPSPGRNFMLAVRYNYQ